MFKKTFKNISINTQNYLGKNINNKVLVIESDDWGSIRIPSKKAYNNLLNFGIAVDKCPYNSNDSLETAEDLEALYEVLLSFRDSQGNPLKITANSIMVNPDFNKIKENKFSEYFYEDFVFTYKRIQNNDETFNLIKQGISSDIYVPQLHGREHLHVNVWLEALRNSDKETLVAFDNEVWGHPSSYFKNSKMNFSSAFHIRNLQDEKFALQSLNDAAKIFKYYFGFQSESFIAPRYIWNNTVEVELNKIGVKYIQGKIVQQIPYENDLKTKVHLFGSRNKLKQIYINRNVFLEPNLNPKFNWMADALNRIDIAFKWKKPAIISMHRLNFMGGLNKTNRKNNLLLLRQLITEVQKRHPDVVFLSTNELGKIIENGKQSSGSHYDAGL
jgi:hypothetical protein